MTADLPSANQNGETFVKRPRRWRRWLVLLLLLSLAGGLAVRWISNPETQAALLTRLVRDQLGADLLLQQPIALRFDPRPGIQAAGATLTLSGDDGPAIATGAIDIALHWDTLWGKDLRVHRVEARQLVADLDRIRRLLPDTGATESAAAWPSIDAGIRLRESVLAVPSAQLTLIAIDLDMSALNAGQPFQATLGFRSAGGSLMAGKYDLEIGFVPAIRNAAHALESLDAALELDIPEIKDRFTASGHMALGDSLTFTLALGSRDGTLPTMQASYEGDYLGPGQLQLQPAPPLDPLSGSYRIDALDTWIAGWSGSLPTTLPAHARIELPTLQWRDWTFEEAVIEIGPQAATEAN